MKYTLVTGASSGIGKEIAKTLSVKHNLILCGRNKEKLSAALSECENKANHIILECDISKVSEIEEKLLSVLSEDIIVNNFVSSAGIIEYSFVKAFNKAEADNIMNVNLFAPMQIISSLLKKKVNRKGLEKAVLISSANSLKQTKAMGIYNASKAGLDAFMKTAALELAPEVRINSVLPGFLKTAGTEKFAEDGENITKSLILGEGKTGYIADAVDFLLSEKAAWITGQQIVVDGGFTIG